MKTIGLLGGMSWESSAEYYRIINEAVQARLRGLHSAQCLPYSFDFAQIEALQHGGRWDEATTRLIAAARQVERGGADFLVLCTNTMHKLADAVQAAITIPLLHIADPTATQIRAAGLTRVGLLGTAFTMEEPFYRGRLEARYGLTVLVPDAHDRRLVHRIIYDELCQGITTMASRKQYVRVIRRLAEQGAEGVILGCTEIGLLIRPADSPLPVFDTTRLHAEAAVDYALRAD